MFTEQVMSLEGFAFAVNYGLNKVRFPAPLPVNSRVRMRATLSSVDDVPGGVQLTITQTFEREGEDPQGSERQEQRRRGHGPCSRCRPGCRGRHSQGAVEMGKLTGGIRRHRRK